MRKILTLGISFDQRCEIGDLRLETGGDLENRLIFQIFQIFQSTPRSDRSKETGVICSKESPRVQ